MAIKKDRIIDKKTADMNMTTSSRTNLLTLSDFMIFSFWLSYDNSNSTTILIL